MNTLDLLTYCLNFAAPISRGQCSFPKIFVVVVFFSNLVINLTHSYKQHDTYRNILNISKRMLRM